MSDPQIIPLQSQWRVCVEDGIAHLEIELQTTGGSPDWSRDFVAFAAKLILDAYRAGYLAGTMEAL
jgi:hypothetical protein